MKKAGFKVVSVLVVALAAPLAMADEERKEQYQEQYKEQQEQLKQQHKAMHQERKRVHHEEKAMHQNRLQEKQDNGFRMNGGGKGKR